MGCNPMTAKQKPKLLTQGTILKSQLDTLRAMRNRIFSSSRCSSGFENSEAYGPKRRKPDQRIWLSIRDLENVFARRITNLGR